MENGKLGNYAQPFVLFILKATGHRQDIYALEVLFVFFNQHLKSEGLHTCKSRAMPMPMPMPMPTNTYVQRSRLDTREVPFKRSNIHTFFLFLFLFLLFLFLLFLFLFSFFPFTLCLFLLPFLDILPLPT